MSGARGRGELAIVLHTHMPYVEGFGTWPFGEEWLWEAILGCYLPLLDLLDEGAPLTLSLTPVLCDQLQAPGVGGRLERYVEEIRGRTHREDVEGWREAGSSALLLELERSSAEHTGALERFRERGGELLPSLARHAQWTSSATHAILPLLATDAGVHAQVQAGVDSHRGRFGAEWKGGFWLPECGHAPHLEPLLADAGVRATCVELTGRYGLGAREHLRPLAGGSGVTLVPIDRETISLVWDGDGYPAHGAYRDYHRHTFHHHNLWANDGSAYDHERALALVREHADDFVSATIERLRRDGQGLPGGGLVVCAVDTELFGHWWYEGVHWLSAVVEACSRRDLELVRLDDAQAMREPGQIDDPPSLRAGGEWEASTWGEGGGLLTWSGPAVADMAFQTRAAELEVLAAGPEAGEAAIRELLALQASDWAFMVSRELAVPYARERFAGHREALRRALDEGPDASTEDLRNLAVYADPAMLLGP